MVTQKHRRAQIIDALAELFEQLKEPSEFPLQTQDAIQRRYIHWTSLEKSGGSPVSYVKFR